MKKFIIVMTFSILSFGCSKAVITCNKPFTDITKIAIYINADNLLMLDSDANINKAPIKKMIAENAKRVLDEKLLHRSDIQLNLLSSSPDCNNTDIIVDSELLQIQNGFRVSGIMDMKIFTCPDKKEIASQRTEAANRDYLDTLKELGENLGKFAFKIISACK
jgi:hypothetical protein